jgi:hypothetical protein
VTPANLESNFITSSMGPAFAGVTSFREVTTLGGMTATSAPPHLGTATFAGIIFTRVLRFDFFPPVM